MACYVDRLSLDRSPRLLLGELGRRMQHSLACLLGVLQRQAQQLAFTNRRKIDGTAQRFEQRIDPVSNQYSMQVEKKRRTW